MKGVLEKQKTGIEMEGIRDKASTELSSGKIDQAQYDERMTAAGAISTNTEVAKQQTEAQKKAKAAQQKQTREQIENLGAQIGAMKRVLDIFKGKTDEASQLNELAQLTNVLAGQFTAYKAKTDNELKSLRRAINSGRNNAL